MQNHATIVAIVAICNILPWQGKAEPENCITAPMILTLMRPEENVQTLFLGYSALLRCASELDVKA